MIISHKHEFIFLKPQKTAGTTVELVLTRHCGDKDIITPFGFDPSTEVLKANNAKNFKQYKKIGDINLHDVYFIFRKLKMPCNNFQEHNNLQEIKSRIDEAVFDRYLKISLIRNPWDHAVSHYNWKKYRGRIQSDFMTYIKDGAYPELWPFLSINKILKVDFILRFENLHEDLNSLLRHLDLPAKAVLPKAKSGIRKESDYRSYYDSETIEIVRVRNLNLIEEFGYQF